MLELEWCEKVSMDGAYSYVGEAVNDCDCSNGKPCWD